MPQYFSLRLEQVIKVVTGIHRCGKSTLLKQYQAELTAQGVSQEQIVFLLFHRCDSWQQHKASLRFSYILKKPAHQKALSGRKVSPNTVSDYVEALTESFIFYPAERFDIVGKQLLKVNKKMYMVDLGLIFSYFSKSQSSTLTTLIPS